MTLRKQIYNALRKYRLRITRADLTALATYGVLSGIDATSFVQLCVPALYMQDRERRAKRRKCRAALKEVRCLLEVRAEYQKTKVRHYYSANSPATPFVENVKTHLVSKDDVKLNVEERLAVFFQTFILKENQWEFAALALFSSRMRARKWVP